MDMATKAKAGANQRPAPSASANTCWAEVMKPNRQPTTRVMARV